MGIRRIKKSTLLIVFVLSLVGGVITAATYRAMQPQSPAAPPVAQDDGPPPGYPAEDVGSEGTTDGVVEVPPDSWLLADHGDQPDTESYIYNETTGPDHPWGGWQEFGTLDKYGVSRDVFDALPNRAADFDHIGKANDARITWMANHGHAMPDGHTWRVLISKLVTVDGEQRLGVTASFGTDNMQSAAIGPSEVWRLEDGGANPTLLSQARWLPMHFFDQ